MFLAWLRLCFAARWTLGTGVSLTSAQRPGGVDLRVDVEHCLVGPQLQEDQRIGVEGTLKDFVLQATRLLLHGAAAVGHGLGKFRTLAGFGVRGYDETNRHSPFLSWCS